MSAHAELIDDLTDALDYYRSSYRPLLDRAIDALTAQPVITDFQYMCPNCKSMWECNGPHLSGKEST